MEEWEASTHRRSISVDQGCPATHYATARRPVPPRLDFRLSWIVDIFGRHHSRPLEKGRRRGPHAGTDFETKSVAGPVPAGYPGCRDYPGGRLVGGGCRRPVLRDHAARAMRSESERRDEPGSSNT